MALPQFDGQKLGADVYDLSFEPQRQDNYQLLIAPPSGDTSVQEPIRLAIQTMQLPNETTDMVEVHFLNERRHFAGKTMYEGGSLSLIDFIDQGTAKAIDTWRRLIYNPVTGKVGWKRNYAGQGTIFMFGPNGTASRQWNLINVWPSNVTWGALDMNSGDKVMIEISIVYDKAIFVGRDAEGRQDGTN